MLIVPETITSPAGFTIIFKAPTFAVDLSTVTAAHVNVLRRDGSSDSWELELVSATPSELVAQYTFGTNEDEITSTGMYYLSPVLEVPGGNVPAETISLFVTAASQFSPKLEATSWIAATSRILSLGPVKSEWVRLTSEDSPYQAVATSPWLALDLSDAPITVTLWEGSDGDAVVLSDFFNEAGSNALTLSASGTQEVPLLDGSFGASQTYNTPGFVLRLKLSDGLWLPW
jgi:hypothetical protein